MTTFIRNWTQGPWYEPILHPALYASNQNFIIQLWQKHCSIVFDTQSLGSYLYGGSMLHLCMSVRRPLCDILLNYSQCRCIVFKNMETVRHLINKHKQISGLVYQVKTSLYAMQIQDVTGRAVSQVKKFNIIQTSNIVTFSYDNYCAAITLPPTALCFPC